MSLAKVRIVVSFFTTPDYRHNCRVLSKSPVKNPGVPPQFNITDYL